MRLWAAGALFSWENPWMSMLWWFATVIELYLLEGVIATVFKQQEYGVPWEKMTLYLHNYPSYHKLNSGRVLARPTAVLRGKCWYNGAEIFRTKLSQTYPVDLGIKMGTLASEDLEMRCKEMKAGRPVPMAMRIHDHGLPSVDPERVQDMMEDEMEAAVMTQAFVP